MTVTDEIFMKLLANLS